MLEHPHAISPSKQQLEKINLLNEFLATYRILKMQEQESKICLNSSSRAGEYFASILGGVKNKEKVLVAYLDSSNAVIETRTIAEGTINEAAVYPRDVLKAALDCDCKSLIIAHNHPGGSMKPSYQDIDLTEKLVSIFTPLNIGIIDHIIVANSSYYSLAETGQMPEASPSKVNYDAINLSSNKIKEAEAEISMHPTGAGVEEIRIFFPLKIITYPKDEYGMEDNCPIDISPSESVAYEEAIIAAIAKENRIFTNDRGLAQYIHDDMLNKKVYSLYPSVENVDGELWGVMTASLKGQLSGEEINELLDFVTGQNSDGYGEAFEQRSIKTSDGEIYVSFWNSENHTLKLENDIKYDPTDFEYKGPVMG